MLINEISFHDAQILKVVEDSEVQTIDFYLNFPVDWENNHFQKKILRFKDVLVYTKKEIPFAGYPAILDVIGLQNAKHTYSKLSGDIGQSAYKIRIDTNAGQRWIEFSSADLLNWETED